MSKTKIQLLFGTSNIIHSDVWRVQSLHQKQSTLPNINCTNNAGKTNKRKHIVVSLLIAVATILIVGCPEPTKDKGSTAPTIKQLLGSLATAVDMPETTDEEKVKKQNKIQAIYALIEKTDPKYKHKPETKDELATFIKAQIWAQGKSGTQNWKSNLDKIDTSQVKNLSYLFSDDKDEGYGLHEYSGLPLLWSPNNPTTAVDMYKGSKAPLPTWHSIAKLRTALEKKPPVQADIKALIDKITKGNPDYKHRPKNSHELIVIIRAEIWAQGEDGKQNWEADLNNIDTSLVKNMSFLFGKRLVKNKNKVDVDKGYGLSAFNGKIDKWDVSSVTTMYGMFWNATAFNQPLNNWDVSSVTNMGYMFASAKAFNQPLNNWVVSKVTDFAGMFTSAIVFDQPLDKWDVSKVTKMYAMFYKATAFNQPLNEWDVSSVKNMSFMFREAKSFNQPLNKWNVEKLEIAKEMFLKAVNFNGNVSTWKPKRINNINGMFFEATAFDQTLEEWEKYLLYNKGDKSYPYKYRWIEVHGMFQNTKIEDLKSAKPKNKNPEWYNYLIFTMKTGNDGAKPPK